MPPGKAGTGGQKCAAPHVTKRNGGYQVAKNIGGKYVSFAFTDSKKKADTLGKALQRFSTSHGRDVETLRSKLQPLITKLGVQQRQTGLRATKSQKVSQVVKKVSQSKPQMGRQTRTAPHVTKRMGGYQVAKNIDKRYVSFAFTDSKEKAEEIGKALQHFSVSHGGDVETLRSMLQPLITRLGVQSRPEPEGGQQKNIAPHVTERNGGYQVAKKIDNKYVTFAFTDSKEKAKDIGEALQRFSKIHGGNEETLQSKLQPLITRLGVQQRRTSPLVTKRKKGYQVVKKVGQKYVHFAFTDSRQKAEEVGKVLRRSCTKHGENVQSLHKDLKPVLKRLGVRQRPALNTQVT